MSRSYDVERDRANVEVAGHPNPFRGKAPRYRTIVADPPWPVQWFGGPGGRRRNATQLGYETMTYDQLQVLNVETLTENHATLFLWTTQEALHQGIARAVAVGWGFERRVGEFIWRKPNFGTGRFPRIGHETCVIYRRGDGSLKHNRDRPQNIHSVQTWSQVYNGGKTNSAKPDGFYDLVEQSHNGPFAELFSRRARFGWDYPIGDEALGGVAA